MRDVPVTANPVDASTPDRDWSAVVAAMCGLMFSVGPLTLYSFGVFVRPLHAEFGWSRTQLSLAVTITQLLGAVFSPAWGMLVDRIGPRPVLLTSIVAMSLLTAGLSLLTPHIWHLYLLFAAFPLLASGASPLGYSSVLIRRFERHLGLALGLATMGVGLSGTVVPPLAQGLIGAFGWRQAYAIIGGIALLIGLPAALVATRHARGPVPRQTGAPMVALRPMLRTRTFVLLCVVFLLLGVTTLGALPQLVPMMIDRGFPPSGAAWVAALTGLAALVSRGGSGWVLDRARAPRVVAVMALLAGIAFLLLDLGSNKPFSYLAALLLGATLGAEVNFIAYLTRHHFVQAAFGRLYGIEFGIFLIGSGAGTLLLGASFDHLGSYRPSLLLFTILNVVVAGVALAVPEHGRPSSPRRQP